MLQYFIAEQILYLCFPSTITDTSHIPSTVTLAKYLSACAEAFKLHVIGTYLFSITSSFIMSNQDHSKYQLGLVTIGFDWLRSNSKETKFGCGDQEASSSAGKNTGVVLVPCLHMEVHPYSYFLWCGYFCGSWVSFVMADEFSVIVTKITSEIGVS